MRVTLRVSGPAEPASIKAEFLIAAVETVVTVTAYVILACDVSDKSPVQRRVGARLSLVRPAVAVTAFASFVAAGSVVAVVLIGVGFTLLMSWLLTKTVLRGRGLGFHAGAAALPKAKCLTYPVHIHYRSDSFCAVAGHPDRGASGRDYLDPG